MNQKQKKQTPPPCDCELYNFPHRYSYRCVEFEQEQKDAKNEERWFRLFDFDQRNQTVRGW